MQAAPLGCIVPGVITLLSVDPTAGNACGLEAAAGQEATAIVSAGLKKERNY